MKIGIGGYGGKGSPQVDTLLVNESDSVEIIEYKNVEKNLKS